jgi:hypothetical protein
VGKDHKHFNAGTEIRSEMPGPRRSPKCAWRYEGRGAPCGRTERWHLFKKPTNPDFWHDFQADEAEHETALELYRSRISRFARGFRTATDGLVKIGRDRSRDRLCVRVDREELGFMLSQLTSVNDRELPEIPAELSKLNVIPEHERFCESDGHALLLVYLGAWLATQTDV